MQASHVEGTTPPGAAVVDKLSNGWAGVFTWAVHEQRERVGGQWAVSDAGRFNQRQPQDKPPEKVTTLTPHAWRIEGSPVVYLLDEGPAGGAAGKRCAVAWEPQSKRHVRAVAYPTAFASTGERNAYSLATAGATVVAGNTTHNGGGTLLRREPRSALDDANSSGLQVFDGDVLELVVGVAEGSPQGLEWVKVAKAGVGAGWIFARNVHVQGHAHVGAAGRFNMPSVPGVQSLHVPPPPGWQQPQPANLQLVALEPKSDIWRDLDARLRSSLPGATLLRVEQIQSANLWRLYYTHKALMATQHGAQHGQGAALVAPQLATRGS